jgi:hypothetical protein
VSSKVLTMNWLATRKEQRKMGADSRHAFVHLARRWNAAFFLISALDCSRNEVPTCHKVCGNKVTCKGLGAGWRAQRAPLLQATMTHTIPPAKYDGLSST